MMQFSQGYTARKCWGWVCMNVLCLFCLRYLPYSRDGGGNSRRQDVGKGQDGHDVSLTPSVEWIAGWKAEREGIPSPAIP